MNVNSNRKQQFFALCGIIAPVLFWSMVLIESSLRPGYSQLYNFVSDLGIGPLAILQNINFIVFGILSLFLSFGIRNCLKTIPGKSLKAVFWFMILFSLGIIFAGIFPEDFLSQNPHNLVSATAFVSIIAAQLLMWNGLKKHDDRKWSRYCKYSLISGTLTFILVIVLKIAITYNIYPGLFQRLFLVASWIWIGVTGLKLFFMTNSPDDLE